MAALPSRSSKRDRARLAGARIQSRSCGEYARCIWTCLGMEEYISFSAEKETAVINASRDHIAVYVRYLTSRPSRRGPKVIAIDSGAGLANATLQQRITAVRLLYDYVMEEGLRSNNPVGRGRYTPGKGFAGFRDRGLIKRPYLWEKSERSQHDQPSSRLMDSANSMPTSSAAEDSSRSFRQLPNQRIQCLPPERSHSAQRKPTDLSHSCVIGSALAVSSTCALQSQT